MSDRPPTDEDPNRLSVDEDLNRLQVTTLQYYLHESNPANGLIRDKTEPGAPASIAAVGLALAAIPVLVERGVISREFAPEFVLRRLRFFRDSPQGPERGCNWLPGLLLPLPRHEDRSPRLGLRAVHDRLGLPVRRDAHLRCLLRRGHRGGGRGPPAGGRALPPGGLAVGAERRRGGLPRLAARDAVSSRTSGPATTRRSWCTCSASARRRFRCRPRATPPIVRPTSGRRSTAASFSIPGRCSRTSSRTSGSISASSVTRSCATTAATTSKTAARRPTSIRSTRGATRSSSPATANIAGASRRPTVPVGRSGG